MAKGWLRGLGTLVALNALVKPAWLLVENEVQDQLGHADYGLVSTQLGLASILVVVSDLGLNTLLTRTLAQHQASRRRWLGQAILLKLALVALYGVVALAVGLILGDRGQALALLAVLVAYQGTVSLLGLARGALQAHGWLRWDGLASIGEKGLLIPLVLGWLWLARQPAPLPYVLAMLATGGMVALLAWVAVAARVGGVEWGWSAQRVAWLLRRGLPFALMMLLYSAQEHLNRPLLRLLADDTAVGLYAGAYRWIAAASMYLWTVLPPYYARFAAERFAPTARRQALLAEAQLVVALPVLFLCALMWADAPRFFLLLDRNTPAQTAAMATCLRILAGGLALNATLGVASTYLTATGREGLVNRLLLLALALLVVVEVALQHLGPAAAAWAWASTFVLLTAGYTWGLARGTDLRLPLAQTLKLGAATALATALLLGLGATPLPWPATWALGGVGLMAVSWALGLLTPLLNALRRRAR